MREKFKRQFSGFVLLFLLLFGFCIPGAFSARAEGTRVFDNANLFSESEKAEIERTVARVSAKTKLDLVVVTTGSAEGKSSEAYADDFYDAGNYGYGSKLSGALYLIDMDNRRIHISTAGGAIQLLSNSEIETLLNLGYSEVTEGHYAASAEKVLAGIQDSYDRAKQKGWSYNAESGVWTKKKHVSPLAALGSLAASLLTALGAVTGVKRNYKMQDGAAKRASTVAGIVSASGAVFGFRYMTDRLLDRNSVRRRIPRSSGGSGGGRSSGPHGSSSTHTSSSGRSHGGGGRSF